MIESPMLADAIEEDKIVYPCVISPKLDGIRCVIVKGVPTSRTWKPIRNKFIQSELKGLPDDLDGELMVKGSFQDVGSSIMSEDGEPDFVYNVFDYVKDSLEKPFVDRLKDLEVVMKLKHSRVSLVPQIMITNREEFLKWEDKWLKDGYEGAMIRDVNGPYKCGRSTAKQGYLVKFKRFKDAECRIIGFNEKLHNANVATKDAFGHTAHSGHKANLKLTGTLGSLTVIGINGDFKDVTFNLPGFNDAQRREIWDHQKKYMNQIVKYKYQPVGVLDKPRFPIFLGFRDKEDM